MNRPEKIEYAEYYETYVSLVEENDIVAAMQSQLDEINELFSQISDEKGLYAYEESKWTIKELLGHLIDGERIFAYRAFRISRGDKTPLPGFDQNPYIENAGYNSIKLADLLKEFLLLRESNILFLNNLTDEMWRQTGVASDHPVSVRAIAYIMVGHIRHHVKILQKRYLAN
jgi:hypothetical protein